MKLPLHEQISRKINVILSKASPKFSAEVKIKKNFNSNPQILRLTLQLCK
jgi:hypothetical protein